MKNIQGTFILGATLFLSQLAEIHTSPAPLKKRACPKKTTTINSPATPVLASSISNNTGEALYNVPNSGFRWTPSLTDKFVINLAGKQTYGVQADAQVYEADPDYDFDPKSMPKNINIVCYMNAGSVEKVRPDIKKFNTEDIGNQYAGWPDERYLNIKSQDVRNIMKQRIEILAKKGCHAIDPDNVDAYAANTGFKLTIEDAIDYYVFLSKTAHSLGLRISMKNNGAVIEKLNERGLLNTIDFGVTEGVYAKSASNQKDADCFHILTKKGKPVFNLVYKDAGKDGGCKESVVDDKAETCRKSKQYNFQTTFQACMLNGEFEFC